MPPLLSICIPTYNRANFLARMLEALLPQAREYPDEVEVLVLDNASTDGTAGLVSSAAAAGDLTYVCNPANLGPLVNVVNGPTHHATGQFVWVLGDHNLLRPGGLGRVIATLKANPGLDLSYVNFRCATHPEHWPVSAAGGYDGPFDYIGNSRHETGPVAQWSELIDCGSSLCTQSYAHIVRREIWTRFWKDRAIGEAYTSGITTYPHTWMIASQGFGAPAWYLGEPVLTIFNGAQSWGNYVDRSGVFLSGLPSLLDLYAKSGLPAEILAQGRKFNVEQIHQLLFHEFQREPGRHWRILGDAIRRTGWTNRHLWAPILSAFLRSGCCATTRQVVHGQRYLLHHCRPARYLRSRGRSNVKTESR